MDRNFVSLYQDYIEGGLDRRGFLGRVAALAGATAATTVISPLAAKAAPVAIVLEKDPRIKIEPAVAIPGGPDKLTGYLVTPTNINMTKVPAKMGGVLVVSENRSTNLNIQDVARRFATEGYVTLAVDYLSPFGGRPLDEEVASQMTAKLKPEDVMACFQAGLKYLRARPDVGKIAVVGFGWGGTIANQLAISDPLVNATIVFYGHNPDLAQVGRIKGPLLAHYAGLDGNILQGVPAYDAALTKAGKAHSFFIYPGANTGFVNENNPSRWDPVATQLSWDRSVAFLSKYMG
jgi:carboxymethylenebutenolidase